jgi:putative peptide zinc metalloprotease protein
MTMGSPTEVEAIRRSPFFRHDIEWVYYQPQNRWVAKDPIAGNFFYFNEIEHTATRFLDGKSKLSEIVELLRREFPTTTISIQWLTLLLRKLDRSSLLLSSLDWPIVSKTPPRPNGISGFLKQLCFATLSVRLPLFRPSDDAAGMRLLASCVFHPIVVAIGFLILVVSGFLVSLRVISNTELSLLDLQNIQGDRIILLFLCYVAVKSLHELGHVLACAHWGASCREIGLLFLFFTPCLYCDTTECWKLSSKWKRAAVAAAGIYIELWIAALAGLVWLNAHTGLLQTISANTIFICSIGTVAINGNPFFRYDGYYILSDLWGVPNLAHQSSQACRQLLVELLGGRRPNATEFDANMYLLAGFSVASFVYRMAVLGLIMWFVWISLVPIGLGFIALLIYVTTAFGLITLLWRFFEGLLASFFSSEPIKLVRTVIFFFAVILFLVYLCCLPLPNSLLVRGTLDFPDKVPMYATENALLKSIGEIEKVIEQRSPLFTLESSEKNLEKLEVEAEIALLQTRVEVLKKAAVSERMAAFELPGVSELLREFEAKRTILNREIAGLQVLAPHKGLFVKAIEKVPTSITSPVDVESTCPIIHVHRIGSLIERGTLLGWFTKKEKVIINALVPESDAKSLRIGMAAHVLLDGASSHSVSGEVTRILPEPVQEIPIELLGDPRFVVIRQTDGRFQPETPHYQVTIDVANGDALNAIKGSLATIRFDLPPSTIAARSLRYLRQSFKQPLN